MAISAANVVVSTDSFNDWITKFNVVAGVISSYALTTNTAGGLGITTGNAYVNGIFSANTLVATQSLRGGNNTVTNSISLGANLALGNNYLTVGNSATATVGMSNVVIGALTANQVLDTYALSAGRTSKYLIQVSNTSAYQSTEILVTHDGGNTFMTEYATISTLGTIASFGTNTASGNLNLLISPATLCSVIFERTLLSL